MTIYKLTIRPLTSFRTPLQSDTIFGHLMWALRYLEGEEALVAFLDRCRSGAPPMLVSAGFPSGYLPLPVLSPGQEPEKQGRKDKKQDRDPTIADRVVRKMLRKALQDDRYLPLELWQEIADHLSGDVLESSLGGACEEQRRLREELRELKEQEQDHSIIHTAVDRVTGSAREGRLFVSEETFYGPGRTFDVWHKVLAKDDDLVARLNRWWRWVQRNGFGRRKSAGHGAFRIECDGLIEADAELPQVANPNGFVTLSAWIPRRGNPTKVTYRTRIKRGKLAETLALPSPWKKPLLMLKPGAVARLPKGEKTVREWYGRMVQDMHWVGESVPDQQKEAVRNVVQYGYAFPLPVHLPKEKV